VPQVTAEEDYPGGLKARTDARAELLASRYTDAAQLPLEWQSIWARCWLFAGLVSDIPDPGDYFVYEVGRESVVVMRGEDGDIGAFYNVCQHRGNRIFSGGQGSVGQIVCPYHGWRYGLDGELAQVPDADRFCPPVSIAERSLKPVRLETWAGLVWINLDPQACTLRDYLGPVLDCLEPFHFENMVLAKHQTVALDANWKTARDNFLEQYHVDFIHPQHAGFVDCCNSRNTLWPHGHSATQVEGFVTNSRYPVPEEVPASLEPLVKSLGLEVSEFSGRISEIRAAVQVQKRKLGVELGFDYSGFSDEQVSDVWQYDIFPNTFMTVQAEEVWIYGPRPHPRDPDKCLFDKFTLQIPLEVSVDPANGLALSPSLCVSRDDERPDHEVFTAQDVIDGRHSLTITLDQDIYYLADMQAGMHSGGFDKAVLNEDEIRVQHFHDWVEYYLSQKPG
jgi:nitrite reductase/ring-hydroxylating ferredoxin subunit